eukprot:131874_1
MGTELSTTPTSDILAEIHTTEEEEPLAQTESITNNPTISLVQNITSISPTDKHTLTNHMSPRGNQFSDSWDLSRSPNMELSKDSSKIIHCKQHINKINSPKWVSGFGTTVVSKNQYKRWRLQIISKNNNNKKLNNKSVNIFIGISDNRITDSNHGTNDLFWVYPYFGYAYYGNNGKKFHLDKRGKIYGKKYRLGDIITVELNRKNNIHSQHNYLNFYTNSRVHGSAFTVDNNRNYVLAIAVKGSQYGIKICD